MIAGIVRNNRTGSLRPYETLQQTETRRVAESMKVEERVVEIFKESDFNRELETAGNNLVVLEVESEHVCQSGFESEAELQWKADKEAAMEPCKAIKHSLQRIARECPDVKFLTMQVGLQRTCCTTQRTCRVRQ
jgi:hypothetical protein